MDAASVVANGLVTSDGMFSLPLYHGTSSAFRESICRHGLSGDFLERKYGLSELLRQAAAWINANDPMSDWWMLNSHVLSKMQPVGPRAAASSWAGFRHDGVYLSPSRSTAIAYAGQAYGGELLAFLAEALSVIERRDPEKAKEIAAGSSGIHALLAGPHTPLLVCVERVPASCLRGERGESFEEYRHQVGKRLSLASDEEDVDRVLSVSNLECTCSISLAQMKFEILVEPAEP